MMLGISVGLACALLLMLSACGGSGSASVAGCADVRLGEVNGQKVTITDIPHPAGVSCSEAEKVAGEWGHQQLGDGYRAQLPPGWACGASSVCRKGTARVTFTLSFDG